MCNKSMWKTIPPGGNFFYIPLQGIMLFYLVADAKWMFGRQPVQFFYLLFIRGSRQGKPDHVRFLTRPAVVIGYPGQFGKI